MSLTREQLQARCGKLGGSDIASLFGCGFQTKRELWLQKKREIETGEVIPSTAKKWILNRGNALEVPMLEWWAEETKRELHLATAHDAPLTKDGFPWAIGSLDAWLFDALVRPGHIKVIPADAKAPTGWSRKDWEEGAPRKYVLQIQFYLWLLDAPYGYLVAALGDDDPIEVKIERDDALIADIVARCEDFMLSIALGDEPSDDEVAEREAIPRTVGLEAEGELLEHTSEFLKLQPMRSDIEKRLDVIRDRIVALSPGAQAITIQGEPALTMVTKETKRTDFKRFNAEHPGLLDNYALPPAVSVYPLLARRKKS